MSSIKIQDYINSGIIEDYCLGVLDTEEMRSVAQQALLHAEIKGEIEEYQSTLTQYAAEFAFTIEPNHKQKTFDIFDNLRAEDNIDIRHLPLLNKYTSAENWLRFLKPILPEKLEEQTLIHDLSDKDGINQFVLWTSADCPYEMHDKFYETVLLLEGKCICHVENETYELSPGDLITIPLYKRHDVKVIDGPVKALVQRIKAA